MTGGFSPRKGGACTRPCGRGGLDISDGWWTVEERKRGAQRVPPFFTHVFCPRRSASGGLGGRRIDSLLFSLPLPWRLQGWYAYRFLSVGHSVGTAALGGPFPPALPCPLSIVHCQLSIIPLSLDHPVGEGLCPLPEDRPFFSQSLICLLHFERKKGIVTGYARRT